MVKAKILFLTLWLLLTEKPWLKVVKTVFSLELKEYEKRGVCPEFHGRVNQEKSW